MKTLKNKFMKMTGMAIFFLYLVPVCDAQCDPDVIVFRTPKGNSICGWYSMEHPDTNYINYWTKCWDSLFPNATLLAPYSETYSCHAYAWIMVEGGPTCHTAMENVFWEDGSYSETTEADAEKIYYYDYVGDYPLGSYKTESHSAVKSDTVGMYESKWGIAPLFRHDPDDTPYQHLQYRKYYRRCNGHSFDFINQTVTTDITIKCNNIYVEGVTVSNNAKLKLETSGEVTIKGPFQIQLGSELKVK